MTQVLAFTSYEKDKFKKTKTYVLNMMNMKPSIEGVQFPVSVHVTAISQYFDKKTEKMRLIRYIPGEGSIYQDEQSPDDKNPKKRQTLTFVKGFLHIDPRETQLIDYIDKCTENGTNTERIGTKKPIFYELKMGGAAKQMNEVAKNNIAATSWVYSAGVADIINYAKILSIDVDREIDEIRWDMKTVAERDPVKFLEGFNNPNTKRKFNILYALEHGILNLNNTTGAITWATGGTICVAPMGRAPVDYFVELTFNDQKGENTYLAICEAIRPKETKAPVKPLSSDGKDELDILIEMSVEKGVVSKSGQWFMYEGTKQIGKKWKEYLKANPEVVSEINNKMKLATV